MLNAIMVGIRAAAGRLLLALVFGALALVVAQAVADNMVEQIGTSPTITPVPVAPAP